MSRKPHSHSLKSHKYHMHQKFINPNLIFTAGMKYYKCLDITSVYISPMAWQWGYNFSGSLLALQWSLPIKLSFYACTVNSGRGNSISNLSALSQTTHTAFGGCEPAMPVSVSNCIVQLINVFTQCQTSWEISPSQEQQSWKYFFLKWLWSPIGVSLHAHSRYIALQYC